MRGSFILAFSIVCTIVVGDNSGFAQRQQERARGNYIEVTKWRSEVLGGDGKRVDLVIGDFDSYRDAARASAKWSDDHPYDLRLTNEREVTFRVYPARPSRPLALPDNATIKMPEIDWVDVDAKQSPRSTKQEDKFLKKLEDLKTSSSDSLAGTVWVSEGYRYKSHTVGKGNQYEFLADGTYRFRSGDWDDKPVKGAWSQVNDTITLTRPGKTDRVCTISGDELKYTFTGGITVGCVHVFKKK